MSLLWVRGDLVGTPHSVSRAELEKPLGSQWGFGCGASVLAEVLSLPREPRLSDYGIPCSLLALLPLSRPHHASVPLDPGMEALHFPVPPRLTHSLSTAICTALGLTAGVLPFTAETGD